MLQPPQLQQPDNTPPNNASALHLVKAGNGRQGNGRQAPSKLKDLSSKISRILGQSRWEASDHEKKEEAAKAIRSFAIREKRLLADTTDPTLPLPYLIADNGAVVAIDANNALLQFALQDAGLNPTDSAYKYIVADLLYNAARRGRKVNLERYSVFKNQQLYLSAGTESMVVAQMVKGKPLLTVKPNGHDGVLFAADACFPPWIPTEPLELESLDCFKPNLLSPEEVQEYSPEIQRALFRIWVVGILTRTTLPILACIGSKGSGKSILMRAVIKLLLGDRADISSQPNSTRDFYAAATSSPIYAIDNLDSQPAKWFSDTLASSCTGVNHTSRELYTNADVFTKPVTAAIAVTTRTAFFASRADITERVLPLFYDELPDNQKRDDKELLREVIANRDALMSGLAIEAISSLHADKQQAGLPGRFQGFARLIEARFSEGRQMLEHCVQAVFLSITDPDPFLEAIKKFVNERGELRGTPKDIFQQVSFPDFIPDPGGGKAIARKLLEMKPALKLAGIILKKENTNGSSTFSIYKAPAIDST